MGLFNLFKKDDPDLTLPKTEQEIWFRDTYAIWSYANYEAFDHFCGLEKNSENASHCRYILGRDWGTKTKQSLLELFDSLTGEYDDTSDIIADMKRFKQSNETADTEKFIYIKNCIAWDLCRATQVLEMAYHGGWIDRDTMNEKSAIAGRLMQNTFDSWNDLISCYLNGYSEWATETFDEQTARENIQIRESSYQLLRNHSTPAYAINWNLKL